MRQLRISETEKRKAENKWYCVEERCPDPNPDDIWHMVWPWTKDKATVEAEFARLSADDSPDQTTASGGTDENR